jgi:hypothetical protein
MFGFLALGALAPQAGCNGTGTTPVCDFPDGANNPESGCGELVEAAASADVTAADVVEEPAPQPDAKADAKADASIDASDATVPPTDSGSPDAPDDVHDASQDHIGDAHHDAKG